MTREDRLAEMGGLHSRAEGEMLYDLAREVPGEQAIVELGSYTGVSALWMVYGSGMGNRAHVTCIDPWPQPSARETDAAHAERQRNALARFVMNMEATDWSVTALRARSTDIAPMWLQPVGLLFIDGDHSYGAVSADINAWAPLVAPGGWLVLHDYLGDDMEPTAVARAVDDLLRPEDWLNARQVDKAWLAQRA